MSVKPALEDLATTADIGRMLGISRSGAQQLTVRTPGFPEPIGKLGHYTIWWRPEVEDWISSRRLARSHRLGGRIRLIPKSPRRG